MVFNPCSNANFPCPRQCPGIPPMVKKVSKSHCNQCHPKAPGKLNNLQIITHSIKLELNTNKNKELVTTTVSPERFRRRLTRTLPPASRQNASAGVGPERFRRNLARAIPQASRHSASRDEEP